MENEPESTQEKTTQQRIDEMLEQLERNGKLAEDQAGALPACFAALDPPTFGLIDSTLHTFREIWKFHPAAEQLCVHACLLVERERVRRILTEGIERAWLAKLLETDSIAGSRES